MTVAQMSINFHRQRAAILVAEPATDGWYINAGLIEPAGEKVSQIVMCNAGLQINFFTGCINGTLTFMNEHDWLAENSFSPRSFCSRRNSRRISDHGDAANFPIFCAGGRIAQN